MKKVLVTIILATMIVSACAAQKTYTPSQLNQMVNNGQYPDQGSAIERETYPAEFSNCKSTLEIMMTEMTEMTESKGYPIKIIDNTDTLYTLKIWFETETITFSCSKSNQAQTVSKESYR